MRRSTILYATLLGIACQQAFADEGVLFEVGPNIQGGTMAGRAALYGDVAPWIRIEAGVMVTKGGYIADVTPELCAGTKSGKFFACGGIGLAYNAVNDPSQSQGTIFHDVVRFGYNLNDKTSLLLGATHYSNGGSYNPVFGTNKNAGMSYIFTGVQYKFH